MDRLGSSDSSLHIDDVLCGVRAGTVRQAYQAIAHAAAAQAGVDPDYLLGRLMDLENAASSGVGGGVAIPHLRLPGLDAPFTLFAKLGASLDFKAVDGEPVDMVVLILSPAADVADHLRRLARVSRLMRDDALRAKLRGVETPDGVHALLLDRQARDLAA